MTTTNVPILGPELTRPHIERRSRTVQMKVSASRGWTVVDVALAVALAAMGVLVTWPAWSNMLHIARVDEESSHIFLAPLIAAWLVWVRRGRLRRCRPRGLVLGPILVALGWGISTLGYHRAIQSFWHGGALIVVIGCIVTVLGRQVFVNFLPAFATLVFMVPIPASIRQPMALPMQTATAEVTQEMFDLLGMPIERSGNLLTINGQEVGIAEACNGMRMVFALFLVSYALAFGEPLRNSVRLLVVGASPFSAIACNVIRMLPTVWLYGHASKTVADDFHNFAGWAMLGLAFLLILGVIRILRWAMIPVVRYPLACE